MKFRLFVFLFSIICIVGKAQVAAPLGFSTDKTRYCVGEKVIITNLIISSSGNVTGYNYGDKPQDTNPDFTLRTYDLSESHIYTKPGTYEIAQKGGNDGLGGVLYGETHTITVIDPVVPTFDIGLCEGKVVNIKFTDGVYQTYTVDNNGTSLSGIPSSPPYQITYTDTLVKTIQVKGECGVSSVIKKFNPLNSLIAPDVINQIGSFNNVTNKNEAVILLNQVANIHYKVNKYISDVLPPIPIDTLLGQTQTTFFKYSYPIGNTEEYYEIVAYDDCGKELKSTMLMIPKLTVVAANNQNNLSWTPIPSTWVNDVQTIEIYKGNSLLKSLLPTDPSNYTDLQIVCGRKYDYQIKVVMKNSVTSFTPPVSVQATSNSKPSALLNLNSTVSGNTIILTWDAPIVSTVKYYTIHRSENNAPYKQLNFSFNNNYTDKQVEPSKNIYCYQVSVTDSCGNISDDSLITCPIKLNTVKNDNDVHQNNWSNYQNSSGIQMDYEVEIFDENGKLIDVVNASQFTNYLNGPVAQDVVLLRYRIKAKFGTSFSYSNTTLIKNDIQLFIPDIFTPNADGANDYFSVYGKYFKNFQMRIYNRWGELVFYTENSKETWNGDFAGQPSPIGAYTYVIEAKDNSGIDFLKKGAVILMR